MSNLKIFAGTSNQELAAKIAKAGGLELGHCEIKRFADGEVQVEINESVRGCNIFMLQSTCPPVNENYMELFVVLDALCRASANEITAVMPYYGYARQDRKVAPRTPITAKCVAQLLKTAGADRLVVVDLHSSQIQGFFDGPFDHLFAIPTLALSWKSKYGSGEEFVVVSPDAGGVERARAFAKHLGSSIAIIDKRRTKPNEAKAFHLIGDVKEKVAIVLDDMIDTAGTLCQSVDSLIKNGAKKVFAIATHPVLSGPAVNRITESRLEKLWVTDTIPLSPKAQICSKIEVVSVAPLIAEAIKRINNKDSVSALFEA